ncbi:hypothetical protein EMIT0111MI5_11284 [Burkholderia sp. IT-111MI5]
MSCGFRRPSRPVPCGNRVARLAPGARHRHCCARTNAELRGTTHDRDAGADAARGDGRGEGERVRKPARRAWPMRVGRWVATRPEQGRRVAQSRAGGRSRARAPASVAYALKAAPGRRAAPMEYADWRRERASISFRGSRRRAGRAGRGP